MFFFVGSSKKSCQWSDKKYLLQAPKYRKCLVNNGSNSLLISETLEASGGHPAVRGTRRSGDSQEIRGQVIHSTVYTV